MAYLVPHIEIPSGCVKFVAGREQIVDVLIRITPPERVAANAAQRR